VAVQRPSEPFMRLSPRGRVVFKFTADLAAWVLAGVFAFLLRLPAQWPSARVMAAYLAIGVAVKIVAIRLGKLERHSWQQTTVPDLLHMAEVVAAGTLILFGLGLLIHAGDTGFPRTVPIIEGIVAVLLMGSARLVVREAVDRSMRRTAPGDAAPRRVLLVGAGRAGAQLVRDFRQHPRERIEPVGFLDDEPVKQKLVLARLPVLGTIDDLPRVVAEHDVEEVLITMPTAPGQRVREVLELSAQAQIPCRILPAITEILAGDVDIYRLRDVQVEDLLGRPLVELDMEAIGYIEGHTVLVTGAGGSIGGELVRQLAQLAPRQIVLLDHDENALHGLGYELDRDHPGLVYDLVVGSVRDREKLDRLIAEHRPEVVFHTAAHKHVPLLERAADDAILNNVGGTLHVAQAAAAGGVRWFVHTSSDKAVDPVSMLGTTKLLAEQVVRAIAERVPEGSTFVSVRFGNVLGSQGSVVRVFQDQIRRGGPVTVTHPEMTRYVMTIPEAARLVIQAGALDANGAVYFLEMGTPILISKLAEDMIRLAGADPEDVRIEYTGLRPGERLTEELHSADETAAPTGHEGIKSVDPGTEPGADLLDLVDALLRAAEAREWGDVGACLDKLYPGFELPAETIDRA
jgi:FlaA1/EpsC-like NDP-sugar epimerase